MDLSCLKCIVTGASSGIGKSTCHVLSGYGATIVGSGRDETALCALKEEGVILDYVVADITQDGECDRLVQEAATLLGGTITTVINAAGGLQAGAVGDVGLNNYQYNMKLNTQAPFEIMTSAIPYLKEAAGASALSGGENRTFNPSIVSVSSVNGKQSFAGCATYCMSKAALDQLTRCASVDLAKFGIRVNCVNPGVVKTNLHRNAGMSEESYQSFLERSLQVTHPLSASLGRVGNPEEVVELIAFLVSDRAKFITGECIAIDGARQNLGAR